MKSIVGILRGIAISIALTVYAWPAVSHGAVMNDYCVRPSFISASIKPNLLMMIDNSASMFDLAFIDKGKKVCSGTTTACTTNADCASGVTCTFTGGRRAYYCYDQTYTSADQDLYAGYFDTAKYYDYDFVNSKFVETASFPANTSCVNNASALAIKPKIYRANILCVNVTAGRVVDKFTARGDYLNWLTASKFDVEKDILTGGKYVAGNLVSESRGCVGQTFVKEANTADFVNYNSPETNNTNTSLNVTFGVRGPYDPYNRSNPSPGGQTYIDVFLGDYDQGDCQAAVTAITSGTNAEIKSTVEACLNYSATGTQTAITKTKVVFQQTMQACWQYRDYVAGTGGHDIGTDEISTVKNQCPDIFDEYGTCLNDPNMVCSASGGCAVGDTCVFGPSAIVPGNPGLLCGNTYEGQFYELDDGSGVCKKKNAADAGACTSDADCGLPGYKCVGASEAGWHLKDGVTDGQIAATHRQFCNDLVVPPVTDPTDATSDSSSYDNVPAIISGIGIEAQLNQPLQTPNGLPITVRVAQAAAPTGVIQTFADKIRMGAMTFNYNGSVSECAANTSIPCPKVCSTTTSKGCAINIDCPAGETCTGDAATVNNKDGAKILHYAGWGTCSNDGAVSCTTDANCTSPGTCTSSGVGDHSSGLISVLDGIGAASWTPFSEGFYNAIGYFASKRRAGYGDASTRIKLNDADFNFDYDPSQYSCQKNNVLLISDGNSTADQHAKPMSLASLYNTAAGGTTGACASYKGSMNLDNLSWLAQSRRLSTFSTSTASTETPPSARERITTYTVLNGQDNGVAGECGSVTMMSNTATKGGGTFYQAKTAAELKASLEQALTRIASEAASGTAASILSNSEGSGANILQAIFYPLKSFDNDVTTVKWIGEVQNFWYYVDPFINKSSLREESETTSQPHVLNVKNDKVLQFFFDPADTQTKVNRYLDADGDGDEDTFVDTVSPDNVQGLWRAGRQLWARNLSTSPRTIKTTLNGTSFINLSQTALTDLSVANAALLLGYLNPNVAGSTDEARRILKYTHGRDIGYCSVTTTFDCTTDAGCSAQIPAGQTCVKPYRSRTLSIGGTSAVWKLGDVISSTPRLASNVKIHAYDLNPPLGYKDATYTTFVDSSTYKNRGMAFVGANDGMLHAFNLGILDVSVTGDNKATLTGSGLGEEAWAFVPKNSLPYLKYMADPLYNHIFTIDGSILVFDASIASPAGCAVSPWNCPKAASSWKTILIGGMGLGGASRPPTDTCTTGAAGTCVKTPIDGVGYSSYFALDVTDPANPSLMWELPANYLQQLGYATSGPAVIRTSAKTDGRNDNTKNGDWWAIFASGPTGPIDTVKNEFLGTSDQNLKLVIRDLESVYYAVIDTGIANAFAGSIVGGAIDTEHWDKTSEGHYTDDAVYIGYVRKCVDTDTGCTVGTWTQGGVLRLIIRDAYNSDNGVSSPNWTVSTVIDGIGPVTSGIGKLQDRKNHKLWLYFGTGRYYHKSDQMNPGMPNRLFGIQEKCYKAIVTRPDSGITTRDDIDDEDLTCRAALTLSDLDDQSTGSVSSTLGTGKYGWYIDLDGQDAGTGAGAERVITTPVALTNGAVFFSSFMPNADICGFSGASYLWATKYDTGDSAPAAALKGKALIQVSTGSFEQVDLSSAFTQKDGSSGGKRRTGAMTGKPPADPPPIISASDNKPLKRILHIQER